jgi:hypothetical protein
MEQILINLVAGALGGDGAGKSSPTFDLAGGAILTAIIGAIKNGAAAWLSGKHLFQMAPEDLPAAVSPKPGGGSTRSVGATLGLWKDNLRQLYEGEALRSVRFRYALLALDIVTVLFIVATSFVPRTRIIEALDVVFGIWILADFSARLLISRHPLQEFTRVSTWTTLRSRPPSSVSPSGCYCSASPAPPIGSALASLAAMVIRGLIECDAAGELNLTKHGARCSRRCWLRKMVDLRRALPQVRHWQLYVWNVDIGHDRDHYSQDRKEHNEAHGQRRLVVRLPV